MEQKIKIAIIGLVILLFISFIIILQINGSKQSLERQIQQLTNENKNLGKQAEDAFRQKRTFEDKINSLERILSASMVVNVHQGGWKSRSLSF